MGIKQMRRDGFVQPEVRTTDYGAQYVTASKETKPEDRKPVDLEPEKEEAPVNEKPLVADENMNGKPLVEEPVPATKEKKVAKAAAKPKGRPKKK